MTLSQFNEIWASTAYPPKPVAEADLRHVETCLSVRLPDDYRRAVLEVGLPRPTIALLDAIAERELMLRCLGGFYSSTEMIEETISWRKIGMPERLVAFASDVSGNTFCFDADGLMNGRPEGSAIWFFDHGSGAVERIAENFDQWIAAFCQVEPWRETGAT